MFDVPCRPRSKIGRHRSFAIWFLFRFSQGEYVMAHSLLIDITANEDSDEHDVKEAALNLVKTLPTQRFTMVRNDGWRRVLCLMEFENPLMLVISEVYLASMDIQAMQV